MRKVKKVLFLLIFTAAVCSKNTPDSESDPSGSNVSLPSPEHKSSTSLEKTIFNRTSVRTFSEKPVSKKSISQLLWAAGGKNIDGVTGATRTYPSAGGLYPLEIYLVADAVDSLEDGVYRYIWDKHSIEVVRKGEFMDELGSTTYSRSFRNDVVPACIVITAVYPKTTSKYGQRGKERYVCMDAGGSAQNVHLQAQSLGLNTYPIGAFDDNKVRSVLGIEGIDEVPLMIIPVGK